MYILLIEETNADDLAIMGIYADNKSAQTAYIMARQLYPTKYLQIESMYVFKTQ